MTQSSRRNRHNLSKAGFHEPRARLVAVLVALAFCVLAGRATMLHIFPRAEQSLVKMADNQYQRSIALAPYRGNIYDRRGHPMAISVRKPSLAINPRVFDPNPEQVRRLAKLLRIKRSRVKALAKRQNYFAWVARQVDYRVSEDVLALEIPGLYEIREPARYYAGGHAAAHLVGLVGSDHRGQFGLERQFDRDLKGQALNLNPSRDALGNVIFREPGGAAPDKPGHSIHLTIDKVIQELTETALAKWVEKSRAKKGYAIVADPHTGRILALANVPTFDPNNRENLSMKLTRNHALADAIEPGSTTKPFVLAAALDQGAVRTNQIFDCQKGVMRIGRHTIHDTHPADKLSAADSLVESSNICAYKIAQKIGREGTRQALIDFGMAQPTPPLGFPGSVRGRIQANPLEWRDIRFANISFGQGFLTTGLELVQAMGAIANGGRVLRSTLVDRVVDADGHIVTVNPQHEIGRAVSEKTASTMRGILQRVVDEEAGTGNLAATESYTTAGKTGTAQKVDPGIRGYAKDKYIASFLGFAPAQLPHVVVYVAIDEPREKPYYGGVWAAPVFSEIVQGTLGYLNVAPDREAPATAAADKGDAGEQERERM